MTYLSNKILIVEDNEMWRDSFREWVGESYEVQVAQNPDQAMGICEKFGPDLVVLDLGLPQIDDGLNLLDELVKLGQDFKIIVVTSYQEHQYALEAQRRGAHSYFSKGDVNLENELPHLVKQTILMQQLERENKALRSKLKERIQFDNMVAVSRQMQAILEMIETVKHSREAVLITGESGAGKEVVARHIFQQGTVLKENFVAINCGALPPNLLESEL
nr:response regulator [Calditrichia bacterium]